MEDEFIIAIVAIGAVFVIFPAMVFHYITLWRKQKTLMPDDERMLEDLWRSFRGAWPAHKDLLGTKKGREAKGTIVKRWPKSALYRGKLRLAR